MNYSRFIDCFEELMITFSDKLTHTCPKEKKTRVAVTFMWPLVPFHQYTWSRGHAGCRRLIRHSDETCISCTLQLLIFVNVVWTMPKHARFQLKPERASEVQSYKNWETYVKILLRPLLVFFLPLQPQRTERE